MMCKPTEHDVSGAGQGQARRRRSLWEIDRTFHCSLIGTCLGLKETRKMLVKAGLRVPVDASDFDVHTNAVQLAENRCRFSKEVTRKLDRRHVATIARYSRAETVVQVESLWREDLESGEVVGAYWALMTHPLTDANLARSAFGEIHMLSHLVGASARVDMKRLSTLESSARALEHQLEAQTKAALSTARKYERKINALEQQLGEKSREVERLQGVEDRLRQLERGELVATLRSRVQSLDGERNALEKRVEHLRVRTLGLDETCQQLAGENDQLKSDLEALTVQHELLEEQLITMLHNENDTVDNLACDQCTHPLCGKTVLCVGGMGKLIQHYRALVESCGGEFMHHDGGRENCVRRLPGLLSQADIVVCPLDAVSHRACHIAKTSCKKMDIPLRLMRQSGLSTFIHSLSECSETQPWTHHASPTTN
jgi:hypothetical protein